jgi:UDP-N-acetylglucosamine 2-epimerase (non-hydrolysing)
MAPVVHALQNESSWCDVRVCVTGQHRELLRPLLAFFQIAPDHDLDVMTENQSLTGLTTRLFTALDPVFTAERPDWLLVQGDTTTSYIAGMTAFYHGVRIGHVEAGLRTPTKRSPFPEEMNRRLLGRLADLHFAPTPAAAEHLRREGVDSVDIVVIGNTAIDALRWAVGHADDPPVEGEPESGARMILVTAHRRESFGAPLERICEAVRHLALQYGAGVRFVVPVHPNPHASETVHRLLDGHPNIQLLPPLSYEAFVRAMLRAHFVLTDSGGAQEEAPSLGTPVLVMRDSTERPEGVAAGVARIVGTETNRIIEESRRLLDDPEEYARMARVVTVYGDGQAASHIVAALRSRALA